MKPFGCARLALLGLLLLSVVDAARGELPVRSLLEMRREGVVAQRWDTSCGAAALATVLTYAFDDPVPETLAVQVMLGRSEPQRVRARGGFSLLDLKGFAESRGYFAAGYRGLRLDDLLRMQSPIVLIEEHGSPHFVVVRGAHEGALDIADPAFGNRRMSVERFNQVWREGIGFVITRPKL